MTIDSYHAQQTVKFKDSVFQALPQTNTNNGYYLLSANKSALQQFVDSEYDDLKIKVNKLIKLIK